MIANKLAILDETDTIKDGCCIPIIQDNETKRISFNNLKKNIFIKKNIMLSFELSNASITPDKLGLNKFNENAIVQISSILYSTEQIYLIKNITEDMINVCLYEISNGTLSKFPLGNQSVIVRYIG